MTGGTRFVSRGPYHVARNVRSPTASVSGWTRARFDASCRERDVAAESEQRVDLGDDDEDRHRVLEPGHDRRGDVADEAAESQGAEQRLEEPRRHDDEEHQGQRALDIAVSGDGARPARHAFEHHRGHDERHHAPRRVHEPSGAAEQGPGEENEYGAHQPGDDAVRDVAVAERLEREDPVAHAHRNGEHARADSARYVTLEGFHSFGSAWIGDASRLNWVAEGAGAPAVSCG